MEFSTRSMVNLLRQQTDKQVSENAANQLGEDLEQFAQSIAEDAVSLALEDGYNTVRSEHIRKVVKQYRNREFKQAYLV